MAAGCRQVLQWHRLVPLPGPRGATPPHLPRLQRPPRAAASSQAHGQGVPLPPCKGQAGAPAPSRGPAGLLQAEPSSGGQRALEPDQALRLVVDMGFSETHTRRLLGIDPGIRPEQMLMVVSELMLLGLEPDPVCKVLQKNPRILRLTDKQLKNRAKHLRQLGLGGGNLQHMAHCCPDLFTMSPKHIDALVSVLKDRCLFTGQQVTEILHSCPRVLQEDPSALEYKFQYAYFRMGIKQQDLVKTRYFQYSMTKIKQRHIFLERLGLYQTPDKKGQTQICNPSVNSVLRVPETEFLAKTAHSTSEEFEVFKKLLVREELEEKEGPSTSEEDSDSSDDEED
ncbi:transcription termination factor 4, mitochondrial [Macrotis lagotis]|uniref:transcription termination factor 4, mitochondrial n=1 Tax=Macrotis lagotis TaxID=92651 RepID=UPI003D69ADCF